MVNGRQMVLLDGYTYYKKNKCGPYYKWACTASASCKGNLKIDDDFVIKTGDPTHSHPRKKLLKTSSGRYIKL